MSTTAPSTTPRTETATATGLAAATPGRDTAAFELALACDLIVAAESASFGLVEATVGLTPAMGGTQRLAERAGSGRARELVMTAERFDAATLHSWGVVNRLWPDDGFDAAAGPGSQAHDEIFISEERGYFRETNHSGGLEGGMTTGEPLWARVAMKPIPTLTKPLRSVDISTGEPAQALRERTDSCVVPAAGVVGEAMVAFVLAAAYREKFGGDHIDDVIAAVRAYEERIRWRRS